MKTKLTAFVGFTFSLLFATGASALSISNANFRDTDLLLIEMNAGNTSEGGVFDLVGNDGDGRDLLGFDPSTHVVLEAIAGVVFAAYDSNGALSLLARVSFQLGSDRVDVEGDATALSGWSQGVFTSGGSQEIVFTSDSLSGSIVLEDIQADGLLDWNVNLNPSDFANGERVMLFGVYLGVRAEVPQSSGSVGDLLPNRVSQVPDSGPTAALLGISILGLLGASRRWGQSLVSRA